MNRTSKKILIFCIFWLFLGGKSSIFAAGTYPAALDQFKLMGAYLGQFNFPKQTQGYSLKNPYGGMFGVKSTSFFGIGVTHVLMDFQDKIDSSLVLKNKITTVDIFAFLPVPSFFEVVVGYGLGSSSLVCNSSQCQSVYGDDLSISHVGSNVSHIYAIFGVLVGKIYHLQVGGHNFNGGSFEVKHSSFSSTRTVEQNFSALSLGFSVAF